MAMVKCRLRVRPMISRSERYERVSVSQMSVASSLLSTNSFQRGWVSQTISESGNDSRSPATAGKVWTISPREPRRTTRKRGSGMRRLANGFEQLPRGVVLGVAHDGHADAQPNGNRALRHSLRRVIGALGVHIGVQIFQQSFDVGLGKDHDIIHDAKRGDELRPGILTKDGTVGPFEIADARIGIHTDNEDVPFAASAFEITNVPDMERIEAAVRKDDGLTQAFVFLQPFAQLIPQNNLGCGLAHGLGARSRCLATDSIEKLFAHDGRCAALHDHQATRNVGDVRGFESRCATSERQRICREHSVAGTGDVHGLITAVNGYLCKPIARFEECGPMPSSGSQERLQFHLRKSCAARSLKFAHVLTDGRVVLGLQLSLVWSSGSDACFRITMQPVARVERDNQGTLAL